jgi:UDP-N-acetylmuramoylalanine--D-glutamate ligase
MILGGFDRELPLESLVHHLVLHQLELRKLLLIGASAKRLASALETGGFTNYEILPDKSMKRIVHKAQAASQPGDSVVLSPGFASFDMFKNFEDRGLQFKAAVEAL